MGRKHTEKAYHQLIDMIDHLRENSFEREVVAERYAFNKLVRSTTGVKTIGIEMEFAQTNLKLVEELSDKAYAFVARTVLPQLKRNNLLWYFPVVGNNSNLRAILAELKLKGVIFPTEVTALYLVNPMKVWRGTIPSAIECTKNVIRENGKVPSIELIRDLRARGDSDTRTAQELLDRLGSTGGPDRIEHTNFGTFLGPCEEDKD